MSAPAHRPMGLALVALVALALDAAPGGGRVAAKAPAKVAKQAKSKAKAQAKGSDGGWSEKTNEKGGVVQELKIQAPTFTEEDQFGYSMPEKYKCDSCHAVMFHLDSDLRKRQPKGRRLKEWEYTDIIDETCRSSFKDYGVKLIDGENALAGPGIVREEVAPGAGAIQMGGESWNKRLGEVCRKIVYERLGEEDFYEHFYKAFGSGQKGPDGRPAIDALCSHELRDCFAGPKPPPKLEEAEKTPAKAKQKPNGRSAKSRKERPAKGQPSGGAADSAPPGAASEDRRVDVQAFLQSLAVKHGLAEDDYTTDRTEREWERLMVAIAGRVFSRVADRAAGSEGSCQSGS